MPKRTQRLESKYPTQPPSGADMAALIGRVDELSKKILSKGFTSKLPNWKRWVGGEAEYDAVGLRDVVNANATMLDQVKAGQDVHSQAIIELRADVEALKEAPPARPFP